MRAIGDSLDVNTTLTQFMFVSFSESMNDKNIFSLVTIFRSSFRGTIFDRAKVKSQLERNVHCYVPYLLIYKFSLCLLFFCLFLFFRFCFNVDAVFTLQIKVRPGCEAVLGSARVLCHGFFYILLAGVCNVQLKCEMAWGPSVHKKFGKYINHLFGALLLAVRRLGHQGAAPCLDPAVMEETLAVCTWGMFTE